MNRTAEAKKMEQVEDRKAEIIEITAFVKESDRAAEDRIAGEILMLTAQTKQMVLFNSIEIGRRLTEAKKIVKHGQWGNWLKERVNYSQRTANNFMNIYRQYGESGLAAKSQSIANLSYTQALALLELPEPERQKFAEEKEAAEMTISKLKEEIEKVKTEKNGVLENAGIEAERFQKQIEEKELECSEAKKRIAELERKLGEEQDKAGQVKEQNEREVKSRIEKAIKAEREKLQNAEKTLAEALKSKEELEKQQEKKISDAREQERKMAKAEFEHESREKEQRLEESEARNREILEKMNEAQELYRKEKGRNGLAGKLATASYLLEQVLDQCAEALDLLEDVRKKDEEKGIELIQDFRTALESLWKKADSKWN